MNVLDKLGKALFLVGFLGLCVFDVVPAIASLGVMLCGGLIEWRVDKLCERE